MFIISFQIYAVKDVIRKRNDEEIHSALVYYELDVERTIQAFLEGNQLKSISNSIDVHHYCIVPSRLTTWYYPDLVFSEMSEKPKLLS